jgi:hypothetical protein
MHYLSIEGMIRKAVLKPALSESSIQAEEHIGGPIPNFADHKQRYEPYSIR